MCTNRIKTVNKLFPQVGGEDRKGIRVPHHDPTQLEAHREIRVLKQSLTDTSQNPPTTVTITVMSLLGITEVLQLTQNDIANHSQGTTWKTGPSSRITWKEEKIDEITSRQMGTTKHQS